MGKLIVTEFLTMDAVLLDLADSITTLTTAGVVVATWDGRLHQAAQAVGLATLPHEL